MFNNNQSIPKSLPGSFLLACVLLVFDGVVSGSFLWSFFVVPVWLVFATTRMFTRRDDRSTAARRMIIVITTSALVFGNALLESRIARANAGRIIQACSQYQAKHGAYPKTLADLVPEYLPSVPHAKYALIFGDYFYFDYRDTHTLMWIAIPPFGRPCYNFEKGRWGYVD